MTSRLPRLPAAGALAALALAACSDPDAPAGRSGTVTVRAYVDRDASGAFSTGDSALANVALALAPLGDAATGGGRQTTTATTDASGVATFAGVAPGSYAVAPPAAAPAGTVLTSNPAPTAVVSFQGTVAPLEFRYAFFPGEIAGVVFRDENANGTFEAGDTPGASLAVLLRRDSAGRAGARVDSVQTSATGAYRFGPLAPGTYWLEFQNPGTIDYGSAGATRSVVVAPRATASVAARFTGSLLSPIAQVRARPTGSGVAVVGALTVRPGSFTSGTGNVNSEIWVQDSTGGIAVFSVPTADTATYQVGDRVEVTGTTSLFSGQLQINQTRVRRLGPGTAPAPRVITAEQYRTRGPLEGQLVRVNGVRVVTVPTGTGAAFTVVGLTAAGDTIQLRVGGALAGLSRGSFTVGSRYDVAGVLTQFNGVSQIKPRGSADVTPAVTPTAIAAVRAAARGTVPPTTPFTVRGVLTVAPNTFTFGTGGASSEVWVQDSTGGIAAVVATADTARFGFNTLVEITGTLGTNAGQLQLTGTTVTPVAPLSATPAPRVVTGAEANALTNEGELVELRGFTVATVGGGTGAAFNVTGTTADGRTVTLRISGLQTGLTRANFVVGTSYTVVGVLSQFNGAAQVKPRFRRDVTP